MDRDADPQLDAMGKELVASTPGLANDSEETLNKLADETNEFLPPCWCCKTTLCDCSSPHPFKMRLVDQIGACYMWWAGAYVDSQGNSNFSRDRWENLREGSRVPPVPKEEAINGVYSVDEQIDDADGGEMTVRVYLHTEKQDPAAPPRPVLIYFHGGGFCINHQDSGGMDNLCLEYAQQGFVVLSMDYRLAPEFPFPTGLRDAFQTIRWAKTIGRGILGDDCDLDGKLVLSGDSSGGNFALVIASLLRDGLDADLRPNEFPQLRAQHLVLIYPALYYIPDVGDIEIQDTHYVLTRPTLAFFVDSYVPGGVEERKKALQDRRLSPLVAGIEGLPRCTVVTASDDALRPTGEKLIELLEEADMPVKPIRANATHGFIVHQFLEEAVRCKQEIFDDLAYLVGDQPEDEEVENTSSEESEEEDDDASVDDAVEN
ncbi:Tuliposide A-converting enzyme 1, chloroplastic [Hondaea fermentalgiana]|uniref:Tuliposide A-converting enzyme 1, chloroplastic n=1 Tax=Hondaea fermentalgiana TaxID=2315210 RepID=A0A2R5GAN4_9STRA|nr:Tuliposide A-converting enzyme 1, chloroplastic [Hondaea fermentalgiana]|eukprot:GBG27655.1 Tuliposide A-converting enzyme 1, chloroplastic [Hondaea fermentalgiana]